jgi:CBS domain-containing protein
MAQQASSSSRRKIQSGLDELKRLSDEIRQDLRRATLELRDEWRELERKLPDPSGAADQLRGATADVADRLLDELRKFRGRLQRSAGAAGGTIGELMTRPPVVCATGDTLARAVSLMWERDVGFLPVIDGEGRLVGTITDRDSAIAAATRGQRVDDLTVDSAMSRQVVSCGPGDGPLQALALMKTNQLRRLPVTEQGRPTGVITLNDLARLALRAPEGPTGLPLEEIVQALVTIARPRQSNGH